MHVEHKVLSIDKFSQEFSNEQKINGMIYFGIYDLFSCMDNYLWMTFERVIEGKRFSTDFRKKDVVRDLLSLESVTSL